MFQEGGGRAFYSTRPDPTVDVMSRMGLGNKKGERDIIICLHGQNRSFSKKKKKDRTGEELAAVAAVAPRPI